MSKGKVVSVKRNEKISPKNIQCSVVVLFDYNEIKAS